jgi:DNA-binding GntR family transcriptional regulator
MSGVLLKRTCMRDRIRDVLVERILDGRYPAGTQLKELVLAREFNVSQAPIREALRELEGSGLVTSERYRGTRVRGTDFQEMRESYELRATLELRALELIMPCSAQLHADLGAPLAQMAAGAQNGDNDQYVDGALNFHRRLVEASGNRMFLNAWDSLHWEVRARVAQQRILKQAGSVEWLVQLHRLLFARMQADDLPGAQLAVRKIFTAVANYL